MSNNDVVKGVLAGAGAALLLGYLYKKNKQKITSFAKGTMEKVPEKIYPLKKMSNEKLAELKDNIDDILAEREVQA